ncbi:MAG: peptidylprolyl isomerase [Myxococcota bacterium]
MSKKGKGESKAPPADPHVARMLRKIPLTSALDTGPVPLPEVKAPSTEGLSVHVPSPPDFTRDDLIRRFNELVRAHAKRRDRAMGEQVELGDEVQLDVLGYARGKLIPFSARVGVWSALEPQALLPGFAETIAASAKVGDSLQLEVVLPDDYPVEALRGVPARFIVDVRAAFALTLPDAESKAFLKALGRGKDLDEVMGSVSQELERELSDQLWLMAQDRVFDELVRRADVKVPRELVDEEIRRRWGQLEGKQLAEKGFDAAEQKEALDVWLEDPVTRRDCERRLQVGLVLKAIVERDKLELTPTKVDELLEALAPAYGFSAEEAKAGVRDEPTAAMHGLFWHLLAVSHVMGKATVHFGDAPAKK